MFKTFCLVFLTYSICFSGETPEKNTSQNQQKTFFSYNNEKAEMLNFAKEEIRKSPRA